MVTPPPLVKGKRMAFINMPMDRVEQIVEAATLYYEENLGQEQIAHRLGVSKATVSRLLRKARELGVVEITVHKLLETDNRLGERLSAEFNLRDALVLVSRGGTYDERLSLVGRLAAQYLDEIVFGGAVLGISWGTAVYHTVNALSPRKKEPVLVVQMIGAVGTGNPQIDGPDLARRLSEVYGGKYKYLHAPLIVDNKEVREALLEESRIKETLEISSKADIALVGIGTVEPSFSSLRRAGYLSERELLALKEQGAVGDVCAYHFDLWGRVLDIDINQRIVGLPLDRLHKIEYVIGVAIGQRKVPAILGALRGKHINVLVTDDVTARKVLEVNEIDPAPTSDGPLEV